MSGIKSIIKIPAFWVFLIIWALGFVFLPNNASAQVQQNALYFQQTDDSTEVGNPSPTAFLIGSFSILDNVEVSTTSVALFRARNISGFCDVTPSASLIIQNGTDLTNIVATDVVAVQSTIDTYVVNFTTSASLLIASSSQWNVLFNPNCGAIPNNTFLVSANASSSFYGYILIDSDLPPPPTPSRIVSIASPLQHEQTSSTTVLFQYDYFKGSDDVLFAGVEIQDISLQQTVLGPTQTIISSGISTFSATTTLVTGGSYAWRPFLYSTISSLRIYGDWIIPFGVVTTSGTTTPYYVPNFASTTDPTFLDFINIPTLLRNKLPFSLFYSVNDVLTGITEIPASSAPTAIFDFVSPSASTTIPALYTALSDVELFSTSTVTELVPEEVSALFLLLQQATIWFFAVMTCYKLTFRVFQKT